MTQTKQQFIIILVICLLILTACQPAQPPATIANVETVVAQTLQAFTAAAPSPMPASGLPVTYNNISFNIPLELNASAVSSTTNEVEFPFINPSNGPMPEHAAFQFTNYPVQGDARIMVFKASEYAAYGQPLQDAVTALLDGQGTSQPLTDALAQGDFYAQVESVNFKNGHGVRYLMQVIMNIGPVNNKDLFYYYQGITNDGAYFISALFHVNAAFLVADGSMDAVTPVDGIPFTNESDMSTYLGAIAQKLNDTPAESFTPSLKLLDDLIESIQVTTP
ncbi:MAG: hypothetical protein HY863_06245 [Chloroflexi bacterium]|nr:hypothetical protein [Chloroflexota bacterium]